MLPLCTRVAAICHTWPITTPTIVSTCVIHLSHLTHRHSGPDPAIPYHHHPDPQTPLCGHDLDQLWSIMFQLRHRESRSMHNPFAASIFAVSNACAPTTSSALFVYKRTHPLHRYIHQCYWRDDDVWVLRDSANCRAMSGFKGTPKPDPPPPSPPGPPGGLCLASHVPIPPIICCCLCRPRRTHSVNCTPKHILCYVPDCCLVLTRNCLLTVLSFRMALFTALI
jgi:hypothetical protein